MAAAILMAAFGLVSLTSCENELAEEFSVEVDPNSDDYLYDSNDPFVAIDFFMLSMARVHENVGNLDGNLPGGNQDVPLYQPDPDDIVFVGKRLNKGDILRLDNLAPGKYFLFADACYNDPASENGFDYVMNCNVTLKCNNMDENGNIIVERGVPLVIKLIVRYART